MSDAEATTQGTPGTPGPSDPGAASNGDVAGDAGPVAADPVDGGARSAGAPAGPGAPGASTGTVSVEELVSLVETLTSERDANFEARARLQAEFENYRKRVTKQELETAARANESLVVKLLPSLDAFDAAVAHGVEGVEPLQQALWVTLEREGLARSVPQGEAFDPNEHEAVLHEEGGPDDEHGVVVEVLRAGYTWKGRVIRPAMVKVRT